jgi:hypothetical protein
MSDLRNLKFYKVKTRPDPDQNFRVRVFFLGFFGYTMLHTLPTVDHRSNITFSLPALDTKEDQEKEEEEERGVYTYGV